MKEQTKAWIDQIPCGPDHYRLTLSAFAVMLGIVVIFDRLGWLS